MKSTLLLQLSQRRQNFFNQKTSTQTKQKKFTPFTYVIKLWVWGCAPFFLLFHCTAMNNIGTRKRGERENAEKIYWKKVYPVFGRSKQRKTYMHELFTSESFNDFWYFDTCSSLGFLCFIEKKLAPIFVRFIYKEKLLFSRAACVIPKGQ